MAIQTQANGYSANGAELNSHQISIDKHPNKCPVCHVTVRPQIIPSPSRVGSLLESFYRCTAETCHRTFIALYEQTNADTPNAMPIFVLKNCVPITPAKAEFDESVGLISPSFISIYEQASSAEDYQLDDIAGPGYRKALEFLIKDYAIKLHPDKVETIKKTELMNVIKTFLNGDSLPIVSARAAWLGNDETHYERRWVGKDLTDLKKLISATTHFISMQTLVADLPIDMPDPKARPAVARG